MQNQLVILLLTTTLLLLLFIVDASTSRRQHYPNPHQHYPRYQDKNATELNTITKNSNNNNLHNKEKYMVVDAKTGIRFNPFAKHHPGRHVCTNYKNTTLPVKTKQAYCKPTYKKYTVRCDGYQLCSGVRLVYETAYKDVITTTNANEVTYECCPGWSQITNRSHGCNKPICSSPCLNGGKCVKPEVCSCPKGFSGAYCEEDLNLPICNVKCQNGGTCLRRDFCICPKGFTGRHCEADVDECKEYKPCDQICYNTPGSYTCECKENFSLQEDGQSCRKEDDDGTAFEAKDLEFEMLDKRLLKLETMIGESHKNDVTKNDIKSIYSDMEGITKDVNNIKDKMFDMETYKKDIYLFKHKLHQVEKKAEKVDDLMQKYDKMKRCASHNKICI